MPEVIKVPKPASTYDPHRPLHKNPLISAQVRHFAEAELQLPEELRTGIDLAGVTTEGQASSYVRAVTKAIHRGGGREQRKAGAGR